MPGAFAKTLSFGVYCIEAYRVSVEVDVSISASDDAKNLFQIVGLPEAAVKESCERVRAAIGNSGLWFPTGRVTVNLVPTDVRKCRCTPPQIQRHGSLVDLAEHVDLAKIICRFDSKNRRPALLENPRIAASERYIFS